ncbi:MAG: dihydroorotase family protein [Symbiobacteriaceae bacterium]|nr:dihydroorotase family protein [Symbiobacteriaceae bacterium]
MKDIYQSYIAQVWGDRGKSRGVQAAGVRDNSGELVLRHGLVYLPSGLQHLDVIVQGGKIAALTASAQGSWGQEIDVRGMVVAPGIIDPHLHLGFMAPLEEELVSETASALAGGITTLGCFFGGLAPHSSYLPQLAQQVARLSRTDILPHLVIHTPEQRAEIPLYVGRFGIRSFKLYMNGIPGLIPAADDPFILETLQMVQQQEGECQVAVHAENSALVAAAQRQTGATALLLVELAEEEAVQRIALYSRRWGSKLYLVHLSSAQGLDMARRQKAANPLLTLETTSPYLCAYPDDLQGDRYIMTPPIRGGNSREALWQGVAAGVIDTVGTDNVTLTLKEKGVGTSQVIPGYPALATHLPSMLSEGLQRGIPLETLLRVMTAGPARAYGIYPQKGALLPGSDADIVVIDLQTPQTVVASKLHSRSDFSIYEGKSLRGWPHTVIKGGRVVYTGGSLTAPPHPAGALLQSFVEGVLP